MGPADKHVQIAVRTEYGRLGGVFPGPYQLLIADLEDRGQWRTQAEVEQATDPQCRCLTVGAQGRGQPPIEPAPRPVQRVGVGQAGVDDLAKLGRIVLRPPADLSCGAIHCVGRQLRAVDEVVTAVLRTSCGPFVVSTFFLVTLDALAMAEDVARSSVVS